MLYMGLHRALCLEIYDSVILELCMVFEMLVDDIPTVDSLRSP